MLRLNVVTVALQWLVPKKGITTVIKQFHPNCLIIHCYCHAMKLALGDAIKNVPVLKGSLENLMN